MECSVARILIQFARPHAEELDPAEMGVLKAHFRDCPACAHVEELERNLDNVLGRAMKTLEYPITLRDRILTAAGVARRSWYRRQLTRTGVAAALLLGLGWASWTFVFNRRPALDVEAVAAELQDYLGLPGEKVEHLVSRKLGLRVAMPPNVNYAYLMRIAVEEMNGRRVAVLHFRRGHESAQIVVVTDGAFDLKASAEQRAGSGGITVELRKHPSNPRIAYLLYYTGDSIEWLFIREQPPPAV